METLTFLNTDIEGSTLLLRSVGDARYGELLAEHHRIIRTALELHNGTEDATAGDSFFAVFSSPRECLAAAADMQRRLSAHPWPSDAQIRVRMGVHTGEVSRNATGFVGYEVHRAARISAIGHGGQVLLSAATVALVSEALPERTSIRDLGSHRLKDLGRPEVVYQLSIAELDEKFPPLRSLDNPELPNNLPTSLNQFIGRDEELADVRRLASESRIVTLTGSGGSGKTRLSLQAAAEMLDHSGDGVWFVELAPISDGSHVATAVINAMDMSYDGAISPADALRHALRDQAVILVIDNCEHVVDAVAQLLEDLLRNCPKIRVIATSREPLGVSGEMVYRVRSLSLPTLDATTATELEGSDSVQLFVTRANAFDQTFEITDDNAALVASICHRLDGIPLAIELAVARLSSMSLEDLSKRLDQRFRLLTGGSRNALPRQQTLGAMVAWSYDLLNENEKRVLRRLTVFVGSFDLSAGEAIASGGDIDEWDIADILGSLVNKSLVIADRTGNFLRYRLLETIRQYGADQLLQIDGEGAMLTLRHQHATYFLDSCEQLSEDLHSSRQVEAFARLDFDRGNIEAAFQHSRQTPDGAQAILKACHAVKTFAETRVWRENFEQLAWAIDVTEGERTPHRAWALLDHLSFEAWMRFSENLPAVDCAVELNYAADIAKEHGDVALEVSVLLQRSYSAQRGLAYDGGDGGRALAADALALAIGLSDPLLIARCHQRLGRVAETADEKKEHLELALVEFRKAQSCVDIAACLFFIAYEIKGSEPDSRERRLMLLNATLSEAEKIGDLSRIDQCVTYLAMWHLVNGDYDEAERLNRLALSSCIRLGRGTAYFGWLALLMARVSAERGNFERAATLTGWMLHHLPDNDDMFAGQWIPEEREFVRFVNDEGRVHLGPQRYEEVFAAGADLSLNQATAMMKQPS